MSKNVGKAAYANTTEMAKYLDTPIASYTHTVNREIVVSAVDTSTDTFTSVGHGLSNGDTMYPVMNNNAGLIYPLNVYAGGMAYLTQANGYYVVNKTNDTFQISLTAGGAAVDLTTNANMDLTKWHFEVPTSTVTISNIPSSQSIRIKMLGKILRQNAPFDVLPNNIVSANEWSYVGSTSYTKPTLSISADVSLDSELIIKTINYMSIKGSVNKAYSSSASAIVHSITNLSIVNLNASYIGVPITSMVFFSSWFANGTTIKIYKEGA